MNLATALGWLDGQFQAHETVDVTYCRGTYTVAAKAVLGRSTFTATEEDGATIEWRSVDFLIRPAELTLGGAEIVPTAGDRIEHTANGKTLTYEVLPLAGETPYRIDEHALRFRIHTKHVKTE